MMNTIRPSPAHTPGPWTYHVLDGSHMWVTDQDDDYVCELVGEDEEGKCKPEHIHGNARLIAAAPDQLKALRQMVLAIEDMVCDESLHITSDCHDLLLQIARIGNQAIAKVEDE